MDVIKVKELHDGGYLVNDEVYVPINQELQEYRSIIEWIAEGNTPEPAFTAEELAGQETETAISEAKEYLTKTDWIVIKITEASVKGDNVTDMLSKYSAELAERALKRELINSLES